MTQSALLSRIDIRASDDRSAGAKVLQYIGRKLRFTQTIFGYKPGIFFVVDVADVPVPASIEVLATAAHVHVDQLVLLGELRGAVADLLIAEATLHAPQHLAELATPRVRWIEADERELQHKLLVAEHRLRQVTTAIERDLKGRISRSAEPPTVPLRTFAVMPPASPWGSADLVDEPPPVVEEEVVAEEESDHHPVQTSPATAARVLEAARAARQAELPQRLPSGARRALGRLPSGVYLVEGSKAPLVMKDMCAALVSGSESGRKSGESTVIDWDGEWPVVLRRYGSHGRIVYRVEDACRRYGVSVDRERGSE